MTQISHAVYFLDYIGFIDFGYFLSRKVNFSNRLSFRLFGFTTS